MLLGLQGRNNLALVTLEAPGFLLTAEVLPVCVPNATVRAALATANTYMGTSGFGWNSDGGWKMNGPLRSIV